MRVERKTTWKKKLLIVFGLIAVAFGIMFAASYPESQRVKAAKILQQKCETAKSDIAVRRKEHEAQTKLFNDKNKREAESINATLAGLGVTIGSMSYFDSSARVGASAELSRLQSQLNDLQTESDAFKVKHEAEWNKINTTEQTLYDCTNDSPISIEQVKTEKYDAAIKAAATAVQLN